MTLLSANWFHGSSVKAQGQNISSCKLFECQWIQSINAILILQAHLGIHKHRSKERCKHEGTTWKSSLSCVTRSVRWYELHLPCLRTRPRLQLWFCQRRMTQYGLCRYSWKTYIMLCISVFFILGPMPKHRIHNYRTLRCFAGHGIFLVLISYFSEDSTVYKLGSCYGMWLLISVVHLQHLGILEK